MVVTLTLMVLLAILAVGMLSLASVALRSATVWNVDATARANARVALMVAISEIQKHAGPDQRVTARADLLDKNSPNSAWTAVWSSAGGEPAYLVSGNEQYTMNLQAAPASHPGGYFKPDQALSDANSVALLERDLPVTEQVRAPLVRIMGERTGSYAYWVSDEGVKARFNIPNPYRQHGVFPDKQLAATTSQSNSTRHASDELKFAWPLNEETLKRGVSLEQGQLLVPDVEDFSRSYFHHLSPYSRGLLTDTKNGGLKRDLTLPFENDDVFLRWFGRSRESETRNAGTKSEGGYTKTGAPDKFFISPVFWHTNNMEVGPNWGTMNHYHSLYKKTANSGSGAFPTLFPHPTAGIQLRRTGWNPYTEYRDASHSNSSQFATDFQHTNNYVAPIPCRMQMGYRLSAIRSTANASDGSPQYEFELDFKPLVGVWNPYNVTFSPNRYRFEWEMSPVLELEVTDMGATTTHKVNLLDWYGRQGQGGFITLLLDTPADVQPGEFRMFSITSSSRLSAGRFRQENTTPEITGKLLPTWGAGGYYKMAVPSQVGTPPKGTTFPPLRVSGNAQARVKSLSLSEQTFADDGWQDTAGNFFTFKPGYNQIAQHDVSTFRTTNFWQPSRDGSETGVTPERITDMPSQTVNELLSSSQELGTWAFALRSTGTDVSQNIRNLIDSNVRAANNNSRWDGSINGEGMTAISPFKGEGPKGRGLLEPGGGFPQADASGQRYRMFGGNGNQTHAVAFDIPHTRPLSLGAFQHAVLGRYCNEPSFVLGNSYANIRVPLDKKINMDFMSSTGSGLITYDTSYLVNENVWDKYFLSGLSPNSDLTVEQFNAIARGERPAPNARFTILNRNLTKGDLISPASPAAEEIGGKLAVEGAFNINSTSVPAWRAVLAGMADLELPSFDPLANGSTQWKKSGGVTFSRFSRNPGEENDFWMGYLSLEDDQLDALATEIVNQVRARGPFLNLGDFVNRSLTQASGTYSGPDIRESGALQSALDHEDVKINSAIPIAVSAKAQNLTGSHFLPIIDGKPKAAGHAGFILQGDILQAIAPIITPRSDTFVIRAYGDATDKNGNVTARAWCEAVVQRSPEYLDPVDSLRGAPASADPLVPAITSETNKRFGRKFGLVSFRWLSQNEI